MHLQSQIQACGQFVYDQSTYQSTIVTEFNITCDQQYKIPLLESLYFGSSIDESEIQEKVQS